MSSYCTTADSSPQSIPNTYFALLLAAVLDKGVPFRFQAGGFSMSPFIRDGDVITLAPLSKPLRCGQVAAFVHPLSNHLVVHRAIRCLNADYLFKGDHSPHPDGWAQHRQVLGRVVRVERNGRRIRLGLGWESRIIALGSRLGLLLPLVSVLLAISRPFKRKSSR